MSVRLSANRWVWLLCVYFMVVLNIGFWQAAWRGARLASGAVDWILLLTMPLFILAVMNIVLQLLFWPRLHRLLVPALLLAGSGVAYAVMVQGIYFNADMMQNLLQTDRTEAAAWLSLKFFLWLLLTGFLPALLYTRSARLRQDGGIFRRLARRLGSIAASLAVVGLLAATVYPHYAFFFRNHKGISHQIVPTNFLGAGIKTLYDTYDAHRPFETVADDARRETRPHERKQVLILVVGETTRAQSWGLNPGAPDTTPQLRQIGGLINYPDVSSCGTATAVSVPCMFSAMSRRDYRGNRARHQENVLDILQRTGIYASWRDNDGGCKGVCDRIRHVDARTSAGPEQCTDEGCFDTVLLNGLQQEIRNMPGDGVIVLHTIGSHGPTYYQRYPTAFRHFTPTCDTAQLQDCHPEHLRNTYHNTVRYIDHILAESIRLLQAQTDADAALWYVSDHGESLGENGLYLHGTPYAVAPKEQTHVPMIFWAGENWYRRNSIHPACLKENAARPYSHDHLFHSLLGLFAVQTAVYRPEEDLFAPCRTQHPAV